MTCLRHDLPFSSCFLAQRKPPPNRTVPQRVCGSLTHNCRVATRNGVNASWRSAPRARLSEPCPLAAFGAPVNKVYPRQHFWVSSAGFMLPRINIGRIITLLVFRISTGVPGGSCRCERPAGAFVLGNRYMNAVWAAFIPLNGALNRNQAYGSQLRLGVWFSAMFWTGGMGVADILCLVLGRYVQDRTESYAPVLRRGRRSAEC